MTDAAISIRVHHALSAAFTLAAEVESTSSRLALFGPSGAGKSSILLCVAGLLTPARGRICVGGRVLFDAASGTDEPPRARRLGYVPQQSWLFPLKTVRENLEFGRPAQPRLAVEDVAETLGIRALLDRRPRLLSGGERQRTALGRAILSEPQGLLCDEPFSALDAGRRDALLDALEEWRRRLDVPLIIVTHQRREVEAMADDVAIVEGGRITAHGRVTELADQLH